MLLCIKKSEKTSDAGVMDSINNLTKVYGWTINCALICDDASKRRQFWVSNLIFAIEVSVFHSSHRGTADLVAAKTTSSP